MRLKLSLAVAILAPLALAHGARAQEVAEQRLRPLAFNWVRGQGAESCISSVELARRVEGVVGLAFVAPRYAEAVVEARVDRGNDGFVANIALVQVDGTILGRRTLGGGGANCRALDDQLAFIVLVMITNQGTVDAVPAEYASLFPPEGEVAPDADRILESGTQSPTPQDQVIAPNPGPTQLVSTASARPSEAEASVSTGSASQKIDQPPSSSIDQGDIGSGPVSADLGVAIGFGILPAVALGPELGLALKVGSAVFLRLSGVWWLRQTESVASTVAAVEFTALQGKVAGCFPWNAADFVISGCVGAFATYSWTQATPELSGQRASGVRWGPVLAIGAGWSFADSLSMQLGLAGHTAFRRDAFQYTDGDGEAQTLFRTARVELETSLGVAWTP